MTDATASAEAAPADKVKKTPEEKAARKAAREKRLANMSPRQLEKRKEIRAKKKAAKEQKATKAEGARTEAADTPKSE